MRVQIQTTSILACRSAPAAAARELLPQAQYSTQRLNDRFPNLSPAAPGRDRVPPGVAAS